jgi:ribokinase
MMDSIYTVDRAPELGESVLGVVYGTACGGKGSNAAVAACRLGAKVTAFGTLGDDSNGETLIKMLSGEGIDTRAMKIKKGGKSGSVVILLEKGGKNRLVICPGANMETTPDGLEETFKDHFDALLLQLEIPLEANIAAVKLAQKNGVITVLDAGPAQEYPLEKLKGLDILSPNETETKALTGIYPNDRASYLAASKILKERNECKYVVLKLGENGSYIYGDGVDEHVLPYKVTAVDPTAAGDAFTGALALKYAETKDIVASAKYANAVGALSTLKVGAQPSLPTDKEVDAFIASYK